MTDRADLRAEHSRLAARAYGLPWTGEGGRLHTEHSPEIEWTKGGLPKSNQPRYLGRHRFDSVVCLPNSPWVGEKDTQFRRNFDLLLFSVNAVPGLLDRIEELEERIEELETEIGGM